jgi:hypothetical protein
MASCQSDYISSVVNNDCWKTMFSQAIKMRNKSIMVIDGVCRWQFTSSSLSISHYFSFETDNDNEECHVETCRHRTVVSFIADRIRRRSLLLVTHSSQRKLDCVRSSRHIASYHSISRMSSDIESSWPCLSSFYVRISMDNRTCLRRMSNLSTHGRR